MLKILKFFERLMATMSTMVNVYFDVLYILVTFYHKIACLYILQNQHFSFWSDTSHSKSFDKITSFLLFQTLFHAKLSLLMVYEV